MKCCLNYDQIDTYLKKADEIKIPYQYYFRCADFFEKYPDKDIVLQAFFNSGPIDWDAMEEIKVLSQGHLIIAVATEQDCAYAQENGFRYYYNYPIGTYWEFNNFLAKYKDCEYIILGAPLFFDLDYVEKHFQKIRAYPTIANYTQVSSEHNYCGTWIRPENLGYYERCVSCIEFIADDIQMEQVLYRIYMEDEEFVGPLNLIVKDLGEKAINNSFIPDKLAIKRYRCRQKCQYGGYCSMCERLTVLTDIDKLEAYKAALDEMKQEQLENL